MRLTIRLKLAAIVVAAGLAIVVVVVGTDLIANRMQAELETIQGRYLPKMDLGPRLEANFERAVASRDPDALAEARDRKGAILEELTAARDVLEPAQAAALREAIEGYF